MKNTISFTLSVVIGLVLSFYVFKQYNNLEGSVKKILFLQAGSFNTKEEVETAMMEVKDYIVEEENGVYNTYVGITASNKTYDKLKTYYDELGVNIIQKEKTITDDKFNEYVAKYDLLLDETTDNKVISLVSNQVLDKYKELVING